MFNARALTRAGPEAAAAFTTRYQEQVTSSNNATDEERQLRQPISASEVDEASSMIFQRAPTTPSDYVFSPSATVPSGPTGGHVYPRLRRNQVLRAEVLAMGHRLAAHPGVQNAIFDDLVEHGHRVPPGRRGIHPNLQAPPGDERGLARLVDMLEPEEGAAQGTSRSSRSVGGGSGPGEMLVHRDRRGLFDYDDETPLPQLNLDPRVSDELEGVYAAVQDDGWEPWMEEKKEDASQNELPSSRLGDGRLGCSCKKCHAAKDPVLAAADGDPSEGKCWKDVLAEYECDICFEVLVGVHVLDNCGHHFCGACMERWIDNAPQGECPVCRTPVDKLVPVRKMDEMIAKAVDSAAPSKERDAWYKRRAHWEGNARRRQEARAAAPSLSVVHAQGVSAGGAGWGRPGVASRHAWMDARGGGGTGSRNGVGREDEDNGEDEDDGFRLNKMQTVIAVAVMLVMAVMKIRGLR